MRSRKIIIPQYNSNLNQTGAAIEDSIELLRYWNDDIPVVEMKKKLTLENVLGKKSYRRRSNFIDFTFCPRYITGYPEGHWKFLKQLIEADVPSDILKQLLYFYTSLNEPFIPFFIDSYLMPRYSEGVVDVSFYDVNDFLKNEIRSGKINVKWNDNVIGRVATGLLSALGGFGILQGKTKRSVAPFLIQLPVFYYITFFITQEGFAGEKLFKHSYWNLFLLNDVEKKHLFLEAHLQKYLWYEEISNIFKIEFKEKTFEEITDVIIKRTT